MKKTLITKDKFKIMSWKNGSGVTAEIDIDPAGSDFKTQDFNWRLSSARIEDENRFSQFPGYDRILTILSGQGLLINNQELGPFEVFEFEGEDQIDCALIENAVEDLNIIFKRDKYQASLQLLNATAPMYLKLDAGIHFFLALSSQVSISGTDLQAPSFLKIENTEVGGIDIAAKVFPVHVLKIDLLEKN